MIPRFVRRGHRERDGTILPGRHLRERRRRCAPSDRGRAIKTGRRHPEDRAEGSPARLPGLRGPLPPVSKSFGSVPVVVIVVIAPVVRGAVGAVIAAGAAPRVGGGRLSGVPPRVGVAGLHAGAIIVPPVCAWARWAMASSRL